MPVAPVIVTVPAKVYLGVVPPASLAKWIVDPATVSLRLLNIVEALPPIAVVPLLVMLTVLVPAVNVPLLVNEVPLKVIVEALAVRVPAEPMVSVPVEMFQLVPKVSSVEVPVPVPWSEILLVLAPCKVLAKVRVKFLVVEAAVGLIVKLPFNTKVLLVA